MSALAIILIVLLTCAVGFTIGYICGRSDDDDNYPHQKGHPYDWE
jgi:hypothetical protein